MEEYEKQQMRDAGRGHLVDPPAERIEDDLPPNQQVTIGHGDLLEMMQASEAWAGLLRRKAEDARREFGALPIAVEAEEQYNGAADRIDQAVARARRDSLRSK